MGHLYLQPCGMSDSRFQLPFSVTSRFIEELTAQEY